MPLFEHLDRLIVVFPGIVDRTDVPIQRLFLWKGVHRSFIGGDDTGRVRNAEIGIAQYEVGVEVDLGRELDDLVAGRDQLVPGFAGIVHVDQAVPGFELLRIAFKELLQGRPRRFVILGAKGGVTPVEVALLLGGFQFVGGPGVVLLARGTQRILQHRGSLHRKAVEIGGFRVFPFFIILLTHLIVPADHGVQRVLVPVLVFLVQVVEGRRRPVREHEVEVALVIMNEAQEIVGVIVARVLFQGGLEQGHGLVPLRRRFADVYLRRTKLDFLRVGRDRYQHGEAEGEQ